ncbi:MAG TPA: hypothetical protein VFW07_27645 [Parafilimonas sp.]|nr:hypothetical protein [Parafilimonas sp.]
MSVTVCRRRLLAKKEKQAKVSFTYARLWQQKRSQVYHVPVPTDAVLRIVRWLRELGVEERLSWRTTLSCKDGGG